MSHTLQPIVEIAEKYKIPHEQLDLYGKYKAKVNYELFNEKEAAKSKLILVTSTTPNKAGAGKTTTSIALAQGLQTAGKRPTLALREPSLGPCFGMKGGATGGGLSSAHPSEDINLHFNGDFHAITSANNLIAALADNYRYYNKKSDNLNRITWKRALDMNDRNLRNIITGLQGNGEPAETGFDITAASEIMAILCLASGMPDLEQRINAIQIGYRGSGAPFSFAELEATGAVLALLKNAIHPNLVQTTEGVACFIHGGPFANIAHGCNSLLATRLAMTFGEYIITEGGFGADLGAEKFLNIKARVGGLSPAATVIVTNTLSLKMHGGIPEAFIRQPNLDGLKAGLKNLERHIENMQGFGQPVVVAFNKFDFDKADEIDYTRKWCEDHGTLFAVSEGFAKGGAGSCELAEQVMLATQNTSRPEIKHTYNLQQPIPEKFENIVKKIYRGASVTFSPQAEKALKKLADSPAAQLPVCIAKTQYSFSQNPNETGVSSGFNIHFQDIILNQGAGFIVAVAGEMLRMPGLPKEPQAKKIRLNGDKITGLQ